MEHGSEGTHNDKFLCIAVGYWDEVCPQRDRGSVLNTCDRPKGVFRSLPVKFLKVNLTILEY